MRRISHILLIAVGLILAFGALPSANVEAQSGQRCFAETGHCIAGRIRQFWEQNGGLPVFGLPITQQREETIEGKPFQVQWFERNRLELHPENARPYDVLLGRLGGDRLTQQGRDWFTFPKSEPQANCRFFPESGHNVCSEVLAAWHASGLELDGRRGKSEAENLALFGLPLSDAQSETIDGKEYTVQWFERARFELHPENKPPYNVLLGLLGAEVHGPAEPSPSPPPPSGQLTLNGSWSGTTSQGKKITANISQNGIDSFSIGFDDLGCGFGGTIGISIVPPIPIKGNAFSYTTPPGYSSLGTSYTFSGTFRSATSADGQLDLTQSTSYPYVPCNKRMIITWNMAKQ
jgi:hypothetical protein